MVNAQLKIDELTATIARLEPLAETERLAEVAGIDNPWRGSAAELDTARVEREWLTDQCKAQALKDDVERLLHEYERQAEASAKLAEAEAKLVGFSETTIEYFKRCNDIMGWTARLSGNGPLIRSQVRRDWMGNVLDVSPLDFNDERRGPLVPDDEWPKVQEYRDLFLKRFGAANQLNGITNGIQALIAKNPALVRVTPRQAVPA